MPHRQLNHPRRGTTVITRICISGFTPVLNVSEGKRIENWKCGLRDQIIRESSRLRSHAMAKCTQHLFPSSTAIDQSSECEVPLNPLEITWPPSLENCDGYLSSLEKKEDQEESECVRQSEVK
jgi:hypothetical protein